MALGYGEDLYILAFDHRGSFQKKLFGISGDPTPDQVKDISAAKQVIFDGFMAARGRVPRPQTAGILIDEQFGAAIARSGKEAGAKLAMPVEASGRDDFEFEYGDDFGKHIEAFGPDFSKVLVRYNPDGDAEMNRTQNARLKRLADWLHANGRRFLYELLVPATKQQLESVGGDQDRYDREVRPDLVVRAIAETQEFGIEADVWKIEGLDSRDDCRRVAEQARTGGRDGVTCVVLGRGASRDRVDHWLKTGAGLPGYNGFAIGRTIWWDALTGLREGKHPRERAVEMIAENYLRSISVYEAAAKG